MNIKVNFFNRVIMQAIASMLITEYIWSNSYMYDEIIMYLVWWAFAIDIGLKVGKKITGFIKKHFRYEK